MTTIYLHIGAHKTGTTSIQKFLENNADFLSQHGFEYPRVCWYGHAQHRLGFAAKGAADPEVGDKPKLEDEIQALLTFLATCENDVIISSEVFFSLPQPAIRRLQKALGAVDIKILACIRRQDNLYISTYNERAKRPENGFNRPISHFLDEPLRVTDELDLLGCLTRWAAIFGRENMTTYCYENGEAVQSFLSALGLQSPPPADQKTRSNTSIPAKALELLRLTKGATHDAAVQYIVLSEAQRIFEGTGSVFLSSLERARILRRFEADNAKLFENFLNSENLYAEKFWSAEFRERNEQPTEPLTRKDMLQVIIELAAVFAKVGISPALFRENGETRPE